MTIDEYIAAQAEAHRPLLNQVRNAIREALPDAVEKISWQMPTFWNRRNIIHFAAMKKHIGIYPGDQAVEHFRSQLDQMGLKSAKGTIQIPYSEKMPIDLIKAIAFWCGSQSK